MTPVVLSIQNRPISYTANTGTDLVLFRSSVGSVIFHTNPRDSLHNNIRAGLVRFSNICRGAPQKMQQQTSYCSLTETRELPHTPAKGRCLAHTAEAGAFV